MREILCKAKTKKNNTWIYGGYYKHLYRTICPIGDYISENDYTEYIIAGGFSDWNMPKQIEHHEIIPETVCEYTGYKILRWKIFENDILGFIIHDDMVDDYTYEEGIVIFHEGKWMVSIVDRSEYQDTERLISLHYVANLPKVKRVGNMIDNPERGHVSYWESHSVELSDEYWMKNEPEKK